MASSRMRGYNPRILGPQRPFATQAETWTAVDTYHDGLLPAVPLERALNYSVEQSQAAGLPDIAVSHQQGIFLNQLVRLATEPARLKGQPVKVVELGLLGAFSTLCLLDGLKSGEDLVTLELDPDSVSVGTKVLKAAGYSPSSSLGSTAASSKPNVAILEGRALESLHEMLDWFGPTGAQFWFIDADKESASQYVAFALEHTSPGGVIFFDNAVRRGAVVEADHPNPPVQGVRAMNELLKNEAKKGTCTASWTQTVGTKGYDGFCFITKS